MVTVLGMFVRGPIIGLIVANIKINHIMSKRCTHSNRLYRYVDIAFAQIKLMVITIQYRDLYSIPVHVNTRRRGNSNKISPVAGL